MKTSDSTSASLAWTQTGISLVVLLAMLGTCGLIDLTARNGQLAGWVESRRLARWKQDNTTYQHALGFVDFENRLLIDEIPRADYCRGGVYFVGSSTVVMSLMSWELPPGQRELIHNYGISGASHAQQFHFIRYLVEHEGLLAAGGEKSLVVLGLFYGNAAPTESGVNGQYVADLFRGQGLFAYSDAGGIEPAAGSGLPRKLRFEKARCSNFLRRSVYNAGLSGGFNLGIRPDVVPTPSYSRPSGKSSGGGGWVATGRRRWPAKWTNSAA